MYKSELYLNVDLDPALYCRKDRVSLHYSKKQESAIKSDACTLQLFFFKLNINISSEIQWDENSYLSNMNISFSFIFRMSKN